jgi:ATP-binding cassette subfamily B protein
MSMQTWQVMRSMTRDSSVKDSQLAPGTARRILGYARPYARPIAVFLVLVVIGSVFVVATPLLLKRIVDEGVIPKDRGVVTRIALVVAALAVAEGVVTLAQRWFSARIGEGLIYDLRTDVFGHVLRQPIAFFTRAQTGALVTRVNSDVLGAQQAFTTVLSSVVSNIVSLTLIIVAMFSLSWQLTLGALVLVPFFVVPARFMGRRLATLAHTQMGLNADLGSRMTERFNVGGALLVKLFGDPRREDSEYSARAARVRDVGVARARRPARAPLRSADLLVQRPRGRHDRARVLLAGLRGPRPPAVRDREGGCGRPSGRGGRPRGGPRRVPLPGGGRDLPPVAGDRDR